MIPISEKSSGGPLVDWVPEGHDRNYTEPAAMSIRIVATPSAWLILMREVHPVSAPSRRDAQSEAPAAAAIGSVGLTKARSVVQCGPRTWKPGPAVRAGRFSA